MSRLAGRAVIVVAAFLLAAPSTHAQTSAVHPGDRMFQAVMKIQDYYRSAERWGARPRPAAPAAVPQPAAPTPVEVTVTEPEAPTEMVTLRGPNGETRSFPIVGGRAAIKTRTILVRPGGALRLTVHGGRVEVRNR